MSGMGFGRAWLAVRSGRIRMAAARSSVIALVGMLGVLIWAVVASGTQPYQTYETAVSADGPVAQYRFDDAVGSKTLVDSAGTFTASNTGITLGGTGPFGGSKSGSFGSTAFASLPSSPLASATAFSAEGWVNWTGGASYKQPIFDFGSSSTNYMYLTPASALTNHTMLFEIRTTAGTVFQVTAPTLTAKAWEYVSVTETSSGTLTLYLNGAQVAQTMGATITPSSLGSTANDWLGKSQVSGDPMFNGSLSNVAFYTKALSTSQILAHYNAAEFPVNTAPPTITGTAKDGQTLTAAPGTWTGLAPITFAYQWTRCNTGGTGCINITSATNTTYQAAHEDVGSTLRVAVTGKNSVGSGSATSNQTATVAALAPSNTALPAISGTAKDGQLLTVSNGSWNGTPPLSYTYQWETCNTEGLSCSNISGATASSYRVITSQIGKTLRAIVTASNTAGSAKATSAKTATITVGPPVNTALPAISGTVRDGQTLTASTGNWAGTAPITYKYQWQACNSTGGSCANISGATASTLVLGPSNVGSTIQVIITAENSNGSASATSPITVVVAAIPPSNTALSTISGTVKDGQTLTASTGTWSGSAPLTYAYQWQSCSRTGGNCANISGATTSAYVLGHGDVGTTLQVVVKATNSGGSASATSAISAVVAALAPANTALPTISGITQESQTLIASVGSWTGTPPLEYSYQWLRCNASGGECMELFKGATSQRYTLVHGDVGSTIRVVVTAINTVGPASATSASTVVISSATLPANTGLPAVSGVTQESQTLTASVGSWTGTLPLSYGYQWRHCNASGGECANLIGATSRNYTLVHGDVGSTIRVVVTASNVGGSTPATSSASAVIAAATPPVNTVLPTISGATLDGQTLVASTGSWTGTSPTYTYQWRRCNASGGECANLVGATSRSYALVHGDVGSTIRVVVTASNVAGSAPVTSASTAVIAAATAPVNTVLPTISGATLDGQTLLASTGSWTGTSPAYSYQWQSCNSQGKECQNITQAISQGYVLSSGDLETTLRVLVTATNAAGSVQATSVASAKIEPGAPSELEAPTVSGNPWAGGTLRASPGAWEGTETEVSYQWQSCNPTGGECANVAGATEAEYKLGTGDIETTLRVRIGVRNGLGAVTAVSPATQVIGVASTLVNTWAPSISGTPQSGQTLTVNHGSWLGSSIISYSYQWQSCNRFGSGCKNIEGASASSYLLSAGDVGSTLRVLVSVAEAKGTAVEASLVTQLIAAEYAPSLEEPPTISGTGLPGYTLTATVGAWSGESPITYAYQWQRCGEGGEGCNPIAGATANSYTLTAGDVGSTVRMLITATNAGGANEALSSTITVSPATLTELAAPSISGVDQLGNTLSANPGIWTGPGTISYAYQWERCNSLGQNCTAVTGATSSTYASGASDVGKAMKVIVTASGTSGKASAPSAPTPVVVSEPTAPENITAPSIEGNPTTGATLTAAPGSWSGSEPITYTYQWQRCNEEGENCANINEATVQTYLLVSGDIGSSLRVIVTATNSTGSASGTSYQSEVVGAPGPPVSSERPVIHGTAKEGEQLFAGNGKWSGSRPLSYFYRWERCNSKGENCVNITGATKPTYLLSSADAGSTLRVSVTVTNSLGGASSVSGQTTIVSAAAEAKVTQALEIAEKTDPSVIAPSTTASLEGQPIKPTTEDPGETLSATSTLTSSSISKETSGEFAVNTPDGELSFTPLGSAPNATTTPTIVNGTAALYAGTSTATDTIVRPEPLGATTLLQLRSKEAPTSYSWQIGLGTDQQLQQLPNGSVAVTEPTSGSSLEGTLPEETLETPEHEPPAETKGEEGYGGEAAEKELEGSLPEESQLEKLPAAPKTTTSEITPKTGELHPQETQPQYESATSAMSSAEAQTGNTTLMVIELPQVMDAAGKNVSASLSVEGDTVTMTVTPGSATFPVTAAMVVGAPNDSASAARAPSAHDGLSDERAESFLHSEEKGKPVENIDTRLKNGPLHVKRARLIINYNTPPNSGLVKEWLEAIGKAGLEPYITLRACEGQAPSYKETNKRLPCPRNHLPTPGEYYNHVKVLMRKLIRGNLGAGVPAVRLWAAWNEPDKNGNPLHHNSGVAAYFWGEAQRAAEDAGCHHHCKVVAGEFAGYLHHHGYVANYEYTILHEERSGSFPVKTKPTVWGLHDYNDLVNVKGERKNGKEVLAKSYVNKEAREFVRHTKTRRMGSPHDWLTEQGVELESTESGPTILKKKLQLQYLAAQDFLRLGAPSEHIEWAYYYQYKAPTEAERQAAKARKEFAFDSAFLESEKPEPADWRPAYCVLALGLEECPPKTTTQAAVSSTITSTAGTVLLDVEPQGSSATYFVQYGTTTAYGQTTTATAVANEVGTQSETVTLNGLQPCTTYHYQAEAENSASEGKPSLGGDQIFTTNCVATAVSAGSYHTCALILGGSVDCWGKGESGEVGNGTTTNSPLPVSVSGITNATAVSAGGNESCALLSGGNVSCWGWNKFGQLGNGTTNDSDVPVSVIGISSATAVSSGRGYACAVLSGGSIDCWGHNEYGTLGNGTENTSLVPVPVSGITNATAVSASQNSTCALLSSGTVDCWGEPYEVYKSSLTPVPIGGISNAVSIGNWSGFTCAVLSGGSIDCWGYNELGMLGNGTTTNSETPVLVSGISGATSLSGGGLGDSACAVLSVGGIDCWGAGGAGELGNGTGANSSTPVPVSGISSATSVSSGETHQCAVLFGGGIDCWGDNEVGNLGDGTTETSFIPVPVHGFG